MNAKEIYNYLDKIFRFNTQEEWDYSVAHLHNYHPVRKILICLDINENIYQISQKNNVDLVISHHPLFIEPPTSKNFHTRKLLGKFKNSKIGLIFLHTPFDKSIYGMNTKLASKLNLSNINVAKDKMTIIGNTKKCKLHKFAKFAKNNLGSDTASYLSRYKNIDVEKVAICGGSAASNMYDLVDEDFDVFITCDLKHHAWVDSVDLNIPIINLNHNIENIFIDEISTKLREFLTNVDIIKAKSSLHIVYL